MMPTTMMTMPIHHLHYHHHQQQLVKEVTYYPTYEIVVMT